MTALVIHTLKKAEGGLTRAELKDIVTWSSFGPQLQRNKNALYNIIDRGVKRGEISAQDDRFYHQAVFQRIKSGELVEALRPPPKKTLPEMIRDIVRERAGGATSAQIKEALLRDKQVAPRLQRNNQYLYTVLGRMRDREELIRIGDHHHVPGQAVQISKNATMTIRKRGRLS